MDKNRSILKDFKENLVCNECEYTEGMMDFLANYKLPKLAQEGGNRKRAVTVDENGKSAGPGAFVAKSLTFKKQIILMSFGPF